MNMPQLPFVFMDESGNKEDDRFFVCGFLQLENPQQFIANLHRVRDQLFNKVQEDRAMRADALRLTQDIDGLYSLAHKHAQFELKFGKVTQNPLHISHPAKNHPLPAKTCPEFVNVPTGMPPPPEQILTRNWIISLRMGDMKWVHRIISTYTPTLSKLSLRRFLFSSTLL